MTILRLIVKRTHLLHYASDLLVLAKRAARIGDDPDASWTIIDSDEEIAADSEEPRKAGRHVKKRRSMKQRNHGIRVAVSTTTTVREIDEPSTSGTLAGGGSKALLAPVVPTSPAEDKSITVTAAPVSPTNQKTPKRSRSTLALSYLDSFRSPSKRTINPLPSDADPRIMLKELNKAVDIFLKLNSQEVAEQITKNLLPLYLSITVSMFRVSLSQLPCLIVSLLAA